MKQTVFGSFQPFTALLSRFRGLNKVIFGSFLFFVGILGATNPVRAADVFTIENLPVDVRAGTAEEARRLAHAQAQMEALRLLLKKLTLPTDHGRIDSLEVEDAGVYVKSLEVENERNSPVRYIASITVDFNEDAVRQFLTHNRMQYAETLSKPLLVIPLYEQNGSVVLWEETNPWQKIWQGYNSSLSLVPMIVPTGSAEDIQRLSAEQARQGSLLAFRDLARRYNASAVLVPYARFVDDTGTKLPYLELAATFYDLDGEEQTVIQTFEHTGTFETLLAQAQQSLTAALDGRWKGENLIQSGESNQLTARINLNSLQQWVTLEQKLKQVGLLQQMKLKAFNPKYADVTFVYSGSQDNFIRALEQKDFQLTRDSNLWWLSF